MTKSQFQLETLSCPSCLQKIEKAVTSLDGVESVRVMFNASRVRVKHDEDTASKEAIKQSIEKLGYQVKRYR